VTLIVAACSSASTPPTTASGSRPTTSAPGVAPGSTATGASTGTVGGAGTGGASTTTVAGRPRRRGPLISRFTPASSAPGGVVTITGHRFDGLVDVAFGGVPGTVDSRGRTHIVVTVPVGARSGTITVMTRFGQASVGGFSVT